MEMESQSLVAGVKPFKVDYCHLLSSWNSFALIQTILSMILKIFPTTLHNPSTRRILNLLTSSYDDDDDEYSFATQEYLMTCSTAITPDSLKMDSLIMVDKHLDTIPETESDEFIKSSVENLVQNPESREDNVIKDDDNDDDNTIKDDDNDDDNTIKDDDNDDDNTIIDDDKYRYNRKGFLKDDERNDDSIFIVDPGWDDYSLQAIKSNRPIPLCPEARRARM
ncbi:hypothetical protein Tco_1057322 [Tanacetum coccineum]|uniref:Uncharacterized protein n=1 Tax=Tanacetum coccineum TaxID=301880 RepID=A0ABQ5H6H4_9ASTR